MRFPDNLQREYDYLLKNNPDIPGIEHPLINISDALKAYFVLAHYFTDESSNATEGMFVGVRDFNLLVSALGRQNTTFGGIRKYSAPIEIASTLFFGMVKNHAFSDGNKRTALLLLLYQLYLFGYVVTAKKNDFEKLVISVASNNLESDYKHIYKKQKKQSKESDPTINTIICIIKKLVKRKDHSYHINPTMREFCDALEGHNVEVSLQGQKIHFHRTVDNGWLRKKREFNSFINFTGWTRCIGADTARKTLKNLSLYEEFASYSDFIVGKESMYTLVDDFSAPLRRLKDR